MKEEYLVSIIIPVYGVEEYIERCAISLFEQTYPNIEYIFVNDCTPDKSIEKLQNVINSYPDRKQMVNVINNISNCGIASVRNIGIRHCHGIFLMYVDSDDWLDLDVVEKCVEKQSENNVDIVVFDRRIYYKNKISDIKLKEVYNKDVFLIEMLKREREISIWGMLIRTSIYRDNNIECKENINMSEDFQTSPRLVYYAKDIAILHDTFYNYECRNVKSISSSYSEKNVQQELVTLDILTNFFSQKEKKFCDAFLYGKSKQLCYYRNNAAYYEMHDLYRNINVLLDKISYDVKRKLPLPYYCGLFIRNELILKYYVKVLKLIKRIANK